MKGRFLDGSVTGIDYCTGTHTGCVDENGYFEYQLGEMITFSIGDLYIGSTLGKSYVTPLDFVAEANGRHVNVSHYQVVNVARFLLTLGHVGKAEREAVTLYGRDMDFVQETQRFETDAVVVAVCKALKRSLVQAALAKNVVRRCAKGILKEHDVQIPTRDGRYVLADVYRPLDDGQYPVVMCMGIFGKEFVLGFCENEEAEDRFYDDYANIETKHMLQNIFLDRMGPKYCVSLPVPNPDPNEQLPGHDGPPARLIPVSENFEQPCAYDWVPYGYAVVLIEEYGLGKNPSQDGKFYQFGSQNAKDFCDAIEWAAAQSWSSGNVGLFGASYYAMTQYLAAQRKPKGLKAMIPIMGDYDSYRDYIRSGGGLFNRADNSDPSGTLQEYSFMDKALEEPFWSEETYGSEALYMSSADIKKIDIPIFTCVEPDASLHGRGSSEAYINCTSKDKKLMIVQGCGIHYWMYNPLYMNKFRSFFDKWLKGIDNTIMEEAAVELQMRTGEGTYYWRQESDWPVPGTIYKRWYLNNGGLTEVEPDVSHVITYNADVNHKVAGRVEGATFISEPLEEELEIAGYIKAGLYVSSTTSDMEIHMKVRVLDQWNREVIYPARTSIERTLPLGFGALKVSHRVLDEEKSRVDLPVYKHTKEAYAPLTPNEIVYCEVGTFPTTGVIKKGWKIRVDIDPVGSRWVDYNENVYRDGAKNSVYTGGATLSFVQLPVLPKR